jgi:hypothetical protein
METSPGILSRLSEKVLGWVALLLLIGIAYAIYKTPGETKAAIWSGIWRSVFWVAIVAAVPWASRFAMSRIMEIGSNWAAFALVGGLLIVDIVAALVLMTGWPGGGWSWFICLAALAVAGTYNYLVTEYLAETTGM